MGIKQAHLTGIGNQSQGSWIESPKLFSWINVKRDAVCWPTCWHEQMYWPDKKQTSLSTRAWGNKTSFTRFPLPKRQHIQRLFSVSQWFLLCYQLAFSLQPTAQKRWKRWGCAPRAPELWSIKTGIVGSETETPDLLITQIMLVCFRYIMMPRVMIELAWEISVYV